MWAHLGRKDYAIVNCQLRDCRFHFKLKDVKFDDRIFHRKLTVDNAESTIKKCRKVDLRHFLWAHLGSNQGPTDYESVALTD